MKLIKLLVLGVLLCSCGATSKKEYFGDDSQGSPICEPGYCHELKKIIVDVNYSQQTDNPTIKEQYLTYVSDWVSSNRDIYPDTPEIVIQEKIRHHFFYYPDDLLSEVFIRIFFYEYDSEVMITIDTLSSYMMYSKSFLCSQRSDEDLTECIREKIDENMRYVFDGYRYNMKISG